jgi:hypothetical protein
MSASEPIACVGRAKPVLPETSQRGNALPVSLASRAAVVTLIVTSVHHVYGALRYATPWRLHVLFLAIPAILAIVASRRRLLRSEADVAARWIFGLTTLVVPVLGIGAFEGLYNHIVKDLLYICGAPTSFLTHLFPPPTYEMPNDVFFETTGVAQAVWGGATALYLLRFARYGVPRANTVPDRAPTHVRPRILASISGEATAVPDPSHLIHLQFRRFAGCPICNLHLHTFARRHDELRAAGVREVVVFHSSADELREYAANLPFVMVADPDKRLYAEFGVESSPRSVFDPRAWSAISRGVLRSFVAVMRGEERLPGIRARGGRLGLPGDFLIAPDGRVIGANYGVHADDQWSADEVLELVREADPRRLIRDLSARS